MAESCAASTSRKMGKVFLLFNLIIFPVYIFALWYSSSAPVEIVYRNDSSMPPYNSSRLQHWGPPETKSNPVEWPGEQGAPFTAPEKKKKVAKFSKQHSFNVLVSDRIAINRTLPDYRSQECREIIYPHKLPTASVIIVFHNEAYSTLLRTINSVIQTSPAALLKEIILIDDKSSKISLRRHLVHYVATLPVRVKLLRRETRTGLIKGRVLGAKMAEGDVIIFLDSHCEATTGWLEPMLARIAEDRSRMVSPAVDIIDDKTFSYGLMSDGVYGGFDWRLRFRWVPVPQREVERRQGKPTEPLRAPMPNGGLVAIDKEFFFRLGGLDDQKSFWGGENVELGLRVWMCGGSIDVIPCSRIGHVFRHPIPYKFPGEKLEDMLLWNAARTVEIWLDNFRMFYYNLYPDAVRKDRGDVSFLRSKKEELKCKDLPWYVENIFPESNIPLDYDYFGQIENINSKYCMDTTHNIMHSTDEAKLKYCHWENGGNPISFTQMFLLTKDKKILNDDLCLDASKNEDALLRRCTNSTSQMWTYHKDLQRIRSRSTKLCLQFENTKTFKLVLRKCDRKVGYQKWFMRNNFDWRAPKKYDN